MNQQLFSQVAHQTFMSFGISVPENWVQPTGKAGQQYIKSMSAADHNHTPMPVSLFRSASTNKHHVATQKDLHRTYSAFINDLATAVTTAWKTWQAGASFTGVIVNAVTASGGMLVGPDMGGLIMMNAPKANPPQLKYSNAVATTIGAAWTAYTATVKFTGAPLFPLFAAFPGPMAPPTPSIPWPLASMAQVPASVSKEALKAAMIGKLGEPQAKFHQQLFDAVATAFDTCFKAWVASTTVTNVLGMGPIPTFAPPFVPVGPVLGGMATMAPGGLITVG